MITTIGGKWTTYRKMGEDTIDKAIMIGDLPDKDSVSKNLPVHGAMDNADPSDPLYIYGTDKAQILKIIEEKPELGEKLHPASGIYQSRSCVCSKIRNGEYS